MNTPGTFTCQCPEGWTGMLCQEDVNECRLLMDKEKERVIEGVMLDAACSVQYGIYARGKAQVRSTSSVRRFPNVGLETVPMFVCLTMPSIFV